jgi:imidazolonepropionase-like amidohydrolase
MEKKANWIKEIYVDHANHPNAPKNLNAPNCSNDRNCLNDANHSSDISQVQYEIPGFVDFHLHAGWTDFDHDDQEKRSMQDIESRIQYCLSELSAMGFRMVRDAGGLESIRTEEWKQSATEHALSVVACCGMVSGENAENNAFQTQAKTRPACWVKIFATGGVGAPPEKVLTPTMKKETFFKLVQEYHAAGKLVMVHTWGGDSLNWCIEAGVDSVEHGIYMNERQAYGLAAGNILYVPTASVYQLLAADGNPMQVAPFFAEHARPAVLAHQKAVGYCVREGVRMTCGTDFYSDPKLLAHEYEEVFALQRYGVPKEMVWAAFCGQTLTSKETGACAHQTIRLNRHPYEIHSPEELKAAIVR